VEVTLRSGSVAHSGSSCGASSSRGGRGDLAAPFGPASAPDAVELDDDATNDADFTAADSNNNNSSSEESVEDESARRVRLLASVVRTNKDYGLGNLVVLLDPDAAAPAKFEAMELQAPTFFASYSVVCAGGFTEVYPPICFRCLRWNLTALFSLCNRDVWTGCGHCSYIQHTRCKDVSSPNPSQTCSALLT
jgi:hypothetical protein